MTERPSDGTGGTRPSVDPSGPPPPSPLGRQAGGGPYRSPGGHSGHGGHGGRSGHGGRRFGRRWRRRMRRRALWTFLVAVLVSAGWTAWNGWTARRHLEAARTAIAQLESDVVYGRAGNAPAVNARVAGIQADISAARAATDDPVWQLGAAVPGLGCPLRGARDLTHVADDLARTALAPLAGAAGGLSPSSLRSGENVNLAPLAAAKAPLATADTALRRITASMGSLPGCGSLGSLTGIRAARDQLTAQTTRISRQTTEASLAAQLLPSMLGGAGERRYLLVVQNDAESRATGGIIGGFGLLTATNGRLHLQDISGNGELPYGAQASKLLELGPQFDARYGSFQADHIWANANLTPDYPTAARIWAALYAKGTGITVNGTITLDPTALSYIVNATGPTQLADGTKITGSNLVSLTESQVYKDIPGRAGRDDFFANVGKASYRAAVASGNSVAIVGALGKAAGQGRLMISSTVPSEQKILLSTPLGGALPTARGAYLGVVTQNATASKLDYWLQRTTTYAMDRRTGDATITVRLHNAAPRNLPSYVTLREDLGDEANPDSVSRTWLSVYGGVGAQLVSATVDGRPAGMAAGVEKGHLVLSRYVSLGSGQTHTLVLRVHEPVVGPAVDVRLQPLVTPDVPVVTGIAAAVQPAATMP